MCAKDQFTVGISQFPVNVYVRPGKVENIVKRLWSNTSLSFELLKQKQKVQTQVIRHIIAKKERKKLFLTRNKDKGFIHFQYASPLS